MKKFDGLLPTYQKNELVYAKIRGYPWWPGIIGQAKLKATDNGERKYEFLVNFIGDNSHSNLYEDKLRKFTIKEIDLKKKNSKKLMDSIAIANDIYRGKYTYKDWRRKHEQKYRRKTKLTSKPKNSTAGDTSDSDQNNSSDSEEDDSSEIERQDQENIILACAQSLSEHNEFNIEACNQKFRQSIPFDCDEDEILPFKKSTTSAKPQKNIVIEDSEEEKKNNHHHLGTSPLRIKQQVVLNENIETNKPNQHSQPTKQEPAYVIETEDDEEEIANTLPLNKSANSTNSEIPQSTPLRTWNFSSPTFSAINAAAAALNLPTVQLNSSKTSIVNNSNPSLKQQDSFSCSTMSNSCQIIQSIAVSQQSEEFLMSTDKNSLKSIDQLAESTKSTLFKLTVSHSNNERKPTKPALSKKSTSWTSKENPSILSHGSSNCSSTSADSPNQDCKINSNTNHQRVRFCDEIEGNPLNLENQDFNQKKDISSSNRRVTRGKKGIKPRGTMSAQMKHLRKSIAVDSISSFEPQNSLKHKKAISKRVKITPVNKKPVSKFEVDAISQEAETSTGLAVDFDSLFALISQKPADTYSIRDSLQIIEKVINGIYKNSVNSDTILEVLSLDYGKFLMCIKDMCFSNSSLHFYSAAMASIYKEKFLELNNKLQMLIKYLSDLLFMKFFDHSEKLKVLNAFNASKVQINETKLEESKERIATEHSSNSKANLSASAEKLSQQLQTPEEIIIEQETSEQSHPSANNHENFQTDLTEEQKNLRKKICMKIMKPLKEFIRDSASLQSYSKQIESMIRQADPKMTVEYKQTCFNLIRFISAVNFSTNISSIEKYIKHGNPKEFSLLNTIIHHVNALSDHQKSPKSNNKNNNMLIESPSLQAQESGDQMSGTHSYKISSPSSSAHIDEEEEEDETQNVESGSSTANTTTNIHEQHRKATLQTESPMKIAQKKAVVVVEEDISSRQVEYFSARKIMSPLKEGNSSQHC